MNMKVLLNCLPPTSIYMPSIGCEILNKHITDNNNIISEVVYWNYLFKDNNSKDVNLYRVENDLNLILPFIAILTEYSDLEVRKRILFKMQEVNPSLKTLGKDYYSNKLEEQTKNIYKVINNELDKHLTEDVAIFGISAKFDSWIPGIVLAREVKKRRPDVKCVLGGIEEENAANILFEYYDVFDFIIWGEGEIPLSSLIEKLKAKDESYSGIPRLLYRSSYTEIASAKYVIDKSTDFLNLSNYPEINFDSYFKYAKDIDKKQIQLPIEISRACRWNKCNFCALSWGNLYRTRNFAKVINQIREHYLKYNTPRFFFVDNDIVGKNINQFEEFLDKLVELSSELGVDFDFHADILHLKFNKRIIKKLSLGGFKSVQIGYEGVSDSMLKKLNKSTTFADNLLFVKFAQKYDIELTITGLIIGIPGEQEEDVYESTDNLHFLRFFLGNKMKELTHNFSNLVLFYETRFWKKLSPPERKKFNINTLNNFFPTDFVKNEHVSYSLFGQWGNPPYMSKWNSFKQVSEYYEKHEFRYYLIEDKGIINYIEYRGDIKIDSLTFDQPEYWEVLKLANDEVISMKELYNKISIKYPDFNEERLKEIVDELKSSYLLYSSKDYSKLISIIDTERLKYENRISN
jgi:radical SAM superfamily enzyme YgiQ (UPF0313 family)